MSDKIFPEGMTPLGDSEFSFSCHPDVACFTLCCKNVDLTLYPYDIVRLKSALQLDSEEFLHRYTTLVKGDNPYFPTLKLRLNEDEPPACPFLQTKGCSVYLDRPSACRTYPLERAVGRTAERGRPQEFFFLASHDYCKGHQELQKYTVKKWCREQRLHEYNAMNDLWAELDTIFAANPWKGEGAYGEKQQLAFLACYNIDGFRRFASQQQLFSLFRISKKEQHNLEQDDYRLHKFALEWLKLFLTGKSSVLQKR